MRVRLIAEPGLSAGVAHTVLCLSFHSSWTDDRQLAHAIHVLGAMSPETVAEGLRDMADWIIQDPHKRVRDVLDAIRRIES